MTATALEVADQLAEKVYALGTNVYARAYAHGEAARSHRTAAALVHSLKALRNGDVAAGVSA
jgi:hypothetical protein